MDNYGATRGATDVYFEIKTTIQLGQLLRQINYYRMSVGGDFIVVSPDTRFIDTLKEQGVHFVEYTG